LLDVSHFSNQLKGHPPLEHPVPAIPEEGHPPSVQGADATEATLALKVDSCFSTCSDPHFSHGTFESAFGTRASNAPPHWRH
jgi:hypothetical protein